MAEPKRVTFVDKPSDSQEIMPSRDLCFLEDVSCVTETYTDKVQDIKRVVFEMRETIPGYGVYLGYEGCRHVPEIVVDEYGYYTLIFRPSKDIK